MILTGGDGFEDAVLCQLRDLVHSPPGILRRVDHASVEFVEGEEALPRVEFLACSMPHGTRSATFLGGL